MNREALNDPLLAEEALPAARRTSRVTPVRLAIGAAALVAVAVVIALAVVGSQGKLQSSSSKPRPQFTTLKQVFPHMPEPTVSEGSAPGLTAHELSFEHVTDDNRRTKFVYRVEMSAENKLVSPDMYPAVRALDCNATHVNMTFPDAAAAQQTVADWPLGSLVLVHGAWGCGESVRAVAGAWTVDSDGVATAATEAMHFRDLFSSAHIEYTSNHTVPTPGSSSSDGPQRRGWLDSLVGTIESAASTVTTAVEDIATGSFTYNDSPFSHDWSIPVASGSDASAGFTYSVGADVALTSNVNINVNDYTLQMFSATVTTTATISAQASLSESSSETWESQPATIVAPMTIVTVYLPIGGVITLPVSLVGAAYLVGKVTLDASVTGGAAYQAQGTLTAGFSYDPTNGQQWIATPGYSFTNPQPPTFTVSGTATASVVFTPQLTMSIGFLGGPQAFAAMALTGTATASATFGNTDAPVAGSCANGQYFLDATLDVSVGAAIDVEVAGDVLYKQSWTPSNVYSQTYPIVNPTCL